VFKTKRAITAEEHAAIVLREQNAERRDFYELLWHTGAAQSAWLQSILLPLGQWQARHSSKAFLHGNVGAGQRGSPASTSNDPAITHSTRRPKIPPATAWVRLLNRMIT
jgi:hypothetical protein